MATKSIIKNAREQFRDFICYESKMIDSSEISTVDIDILGFCAVRAYPGGTVKVVRTDGVETAFNDLDLNSMALICAAVETAFNNICNIRSDD